MTQADLAARTGLSSKHVNQVVKGAVPLSADVALLLERALGLPSRLWNGLEAQHRDAITKRAALDRLTEHIGWAKSFPVKELVQRGVVPEQTSDGVLVSRLLTFFGVADPTRWRELYASAAFRRAQHLPVDVPGTTAWLRLAELAATQQLSQRHVEPYSARAFRQQFPKLRRLTAVKDDQEALKDLQDLCANVGVLVVFVPEIAGTRVSGATRWLSDHPCIALTSRYQSHDILWFSFFHEAGHVLLHQKRGTYVALKAEGDDSDGFEAAADRFAAETLIPASAEPAFQRIRQPWEAQALAADLGIDPGIVAGRLGRETGHWPKWSKLRRSIKIPGDCR